VLQSRSKDSTQQGWLLKKGEYVQATQELHNTDPSYFEDPLVWKADRHIRYEGDEKKATVDFGTIRPYGELASPCLCSAW
jgi:cytochrome P450